jgi:glutamyl-tRNA synthetase
VCLWVALPLIPTKLSWLNGEWLKAMALPDFMQAFQQWAINPEYLSQVAKQMQSRIQTLSEAAIG